MSRKIRLGAFLPGGGQHVAAWRHPGSPSDGATNLAFHIELAKTAEKGLFDAYFLADGLSAGFAGGREGGSAKAAGFEPVTLFAALSAHTKRLGFIATASTTYEEPYQLARKFASLDLVTGGRAGWNVVTSTGDETARNFSRDTQLPHAERYARAREHVDVVRQLWDSWEDDAFLRDKESGQFFDRDRVHEINYEGEYFKVRGPLNTPRPPQGHPVVVQAGASEDGRDLAAATAEVIFTAHQNLSSAQEFYRDIKARAAAKGRDPREILVMPGVAPFIGRTLGEAQAKYDRLTSLILPEEGLALLNGLAGGTLDLTGYPLDGPLPPQDVTEGNKSRQVLIREIADRHGFTIRQLYQYVATARGHLTLIGTPKTIVDTLEEWFTSDAADGFNILPPWLPAGLEDFVGLIVPELQRRGLFRTEYEGRTLRENLGLARPENPWTRARSALAAE
ncbi:LLM class flavin-dependent oxidoreductase [Paracoccus aminophilus]|uniref:Monooxygenase n=1 Tax=Paracoccus aminophilus JCM 7686 TaxID=1367847 RepID=S5Y682_PARAH|nr:LLM class flavin-dependent oxidoreductase [Paracoccus aminophilus]AGT11155.1 monooxygenase [Paracoccus aminophilus JCM 7686]